jgi:hypothetical protein
MPDGTLDELDSLPRLQLTLQDREQRVEAIGLVDSGAVHTGRPGRGPAEQAPPGRHTADGGEPVGGWSAPEVEERPVALQNVQGAEAEAAGVETPGGGREVSAVGAMPHRVRERRGGEEGG